LPVGERFFMETKYSRGASPAPTRVLWRPPLYKEYPGELPRVPLARPGARGGMPLWEAVGRRRSFREFSGGEISPEELSRLLWATQGITGEVSGFALRAAPSAGATYPVETYLVVNRVRDLSMGVYHFDVRGFSLRMLEGGNFSHAVAEAALGQGWMRLCSVVFVWTAVFDRCRARYGERAFRYVFMDVGHICQNLYLAAVSLGLGCCGVGAFYDDEVNRIVGVDGVRESVLYMAAVGR